MDDDSFTALRVERVGAVLRVTIDNPASKLNTVDERLHHELTALFAALRDEREARAVVLTGSGRAFSAGGDFDWFPELRDVERLDALRHDARQLITDLLDVELPIVAAVNGPAIGLGASIALLCDVILIADDATLADPHATVGIVAGVGGAVLWPLAVGPAPAKPYLLTGDPVPARRLAGTVRRHHPALADPRGHRGGHAARPRRSLPTLLRPLRAGAAGRAAAVPVGRRRGHLHAHGRGIAPPGRAPRRRPRARALPHAGHLDDPARRRRPARRRHAVRVGVSGGAELHAGGAGPRSRHDPDDRLPGPPR